MSLGALRKKLNRLPMAMFRIEKAMNHATKVNSPISDMPHGSVNGSRMDDNVCMLQDAKAAYKTLKSQIKEMQQHYEPMFDKLEDPLARTAMKMRYINGYSAREIAYKINYSESHIFLILRRAEKEVEEHDSDDDVPD